MKYSEIISLGVALNAKCNNAKLINLWFQAKRVYISQFIDWGEDAEMEKKDNTLNYLNAKLTEIIYTT